MRGNGVIHVSQDLHEDDVVVSRNQRGHQVIDAALAGETAVEHTRPRRPELLCLTSNGNTDKRQGAGAESRNFARLTWNSTAMTHLLIVNQIFSQSPVAESESSIT